MLNKVLDLVRGVASETINGSSDIPSDKKNLAIDTTTSAISNGLSNNASGLASLFGGTSSNNLIDAITSSVATSIAEKVGISPSIAKGLASSIVPAVMSKISNKNNGFSAETLLAAFSGGETKDGGILGKLSGLFGK